MSAATQVSFRDPAGRVIAAGGRIFRVVTRAGAEDLAAFLRSGTAERYLRARLLVGTESRHAPEQVADSLVSRSGPLLDGELLFEHERIPFPSFPYEWPPEMLHAAGELTLSLAADSLGEGFGLKDGTPYNVLFRGPSPVFVDVLSFERRDPRDPTWLACAQFERMFLLPLMASKYLGMRLDGMLATRRDGLEPEEAYSWLKTSLRYRPPFLGMVTIPALLGRRRRQDDLGIYRKTTCSDPEKARFILASLFRRLRRSLRLVAPKPGKKSVWSAYAESNSYPADETAAKQEFVRQALAEFRPKKVLDVGANTGVFSAIAAESGAAVVAIDSDPVVVGETWRWASSGGLDILPLVVDLARPTPALGWRNRECPSFLDRAAGTFDAVLLLAVIHHMLVTERIPLPEIVDAAAELTNDLAVIEFVETQDPMFRRIARGRDELHKNLTPESFESAVRQRFEIVRMRRREGATRRLYLLRRKRL